MREVIDVKKEKEKQDSAKLKELEENLTSTQLALTEVYELITKA